MFQIELTDDGHKRVFEAETGTSLVLTGTSRRFTIYNFLMTQSALRIPFEVRVNHATDPTTGEEYRYYTFVVFGRLATDPPGPALLEPQRELFWKQKAAAALVVYGNHHDGLDYPPQRNRVLLDGRLYTRLDFGFNS